MAADLIQNEAGWSGHAALGVGYVSMENSEIAGTKVLDLENKQINNYGSASSQSSVIPVINGLIRYTLDDKATEFFLGNSMDDYLRLDSSIALGVRHDFKDTGIIGARLLVSASPTEVYRDPLLTGANRSKANRTSVGFGLKWEKIMESDFDFDFFAKSENIKKDRNGQSLVGTLITQDQQRTLRRDGTIGSAQLSYTYKINESNKLIPSAKFLGSNRDGSARDNTAFEIQLQHVYTENQWLVKSTVSGGASSFDNRNPVFNEKQDTTLWAAGMDVTYLQPFGLKNWGVNGGVLASTGNSDIKFYDTQIFVAHVGMVYSF